MIHLVNLSETATAEKPAVRRHDDEFESFASFEGRHLSLDPATGRVHRQVRTAPWHEWPDLRHGFDCRLVERSRIVEAIRPN
ncbi:MAG: hypothetical protein Q8O94_00840 [bacterium]|nr:hypothetical protein [bacterium]